MSTAKIPATPGDPGPVDAQSAGGSEIGQDIAGRLAALDQLYESRRITATELGEARRQILASVEAPPASAPLVPDPRSGVPPGESAQPPASAVASGSGGAPPPTQVVTAQIGPPEPPPNKTIAGLPVWAAAAIAGVAIVAVVALLALVLRGGGGSESASASGAEYATQIKAPLNLLTVSAVSTGKALARVSEPAEITAFNKVAERQLDVVEEARERLSSVDVAAEDRKAQGRLIAAAAAQRRYLVQLGRASAGTPDKDSLDALNRARQAGGLTLDAYKTFFALAPAAPDAITATDLTDTSGLRSAITKSIAASEEPRTTSPGGSRQSSPRTYTTPSFQSPTGNLHCENSGGTLFCSSSNDGFGVSLPSYGPPSSGQGYASGGETVPYGSNWVNGPFSCDSAYNGITCRNQSGNGFFLNRSEYNPF